MQDSITAQGGGEGVPRRYGERGELHCAALRDQVSIVRAPELQLLSVRGAPRVLVVSYG
jgi:hypothetical protein